MRELKRLFPFGSISITGVLISLTMPAIAGATTLKDLVDNQQSFIQNGDKRFEHFSAVVMGFGGYTADPAQINVSAIQHGSAYGLLFENAATGIPIMSASVNSFVDMILDFDVVVTTPPNVVRAIQLAFDGNAPADGFAQVVETARNGTTVVGQTSVLLPGGPTDVTLNIDPFYTTLHITKDLAVVGGLQQGADILWVEQSFPQLPPEPTTILLLALGAVGLSRPRRVAKALVKGAPLVLTLATLLAVFASPVRVMATPLDQLISSQGSVVQDDKRFEHFTWNVAAVGRTIANPAAIDVKGITIGDEIGIRFGGLLAAMPNAQPNSSLTVTIGFDVTVTRPGWLIDDVTLAFNGITNSPQGLATVIETVWAGNGLVGTAFVTTPSPLSDHRYLNGAYSTLHVNKVIELYSGSATGLTTISFIDQTFSQIPEPATLALLAIGVPALWRRRKQNG